MDRKPMNKFLGNEKQSLLFVTILLLLVGTVTAELPTSQKINKQYLDKEVVKVIFAPKHETILSSEVSSQILDIPKNLGQTVSTDEPIIILDDLEYRARYVKAKGDLEKSKKRYDAIKQLFDKQEESLIRLAEAKSEYITAKAEHLFAKKKLKDTSIHSPFEGKIANVLVKEYEYAERGKPLIEVINDQKLIGKMLLPAKLRSAIDLNQEIELYVPLISQTVNGKITNIGPMIDPTSSTLKVEIEVDNSDQKIVPGMLGLTFWE